jgi:hypothetical protein
LLFSESENMILVTGRKISMVAAKALSPHIGVPVTGSSQCTLHRTPVHGVEAFQ